MINKIAATDIAPENINASNTIGNNKTPKINFVIPHVALIATNDTLNTNPIIQIRKINVSISFVPPYLRFILIYSKLTH